MRIAVLGAAIVFMSASAMGSDKDNQAAAEEKEPKEKLICQTERVTGSLTRTRKICLTSAQWKELHAGTKRGLDDFTKGASGGCQAPSDPSKGSMC